MLQYENLIHISRLMAQWSLPQGFSSVLGTVRRRGMTVRSYCSAVFEPFCPLAPAERQETIGP